MVRLNLDERQLLAHGTLPHVEPWMVAKTAGFVLIRPVVGDSGGAFEANGDCQQHHDVGGRQQRLQRDLRPGRQYRVGGADAPGFYLLFVLDAQGVPSVASFVSLG